MFTFEGAQAKELEQYYHDHYSRLSYIRDQVVHYTPPQSKVLDIGAKPFVLSYQLLQLGYDYTGIGVSGQEKDLRLDQTLACSTGPTKNAHFNVILIDEKDEKKKHWSVPMHEVNIEMNEWPFEKGTFDTLVWTETLEHLTCDPSFAWHEANKSLKLNGILLFSVPSALYWVRAIQLLLGKNIDDPYSWHGPFGRHNRLYTLKEIKVLAKSHGFEVVKIDTMTFTPDKQSLLKRIAYKFITAIGKLTGKRKGKTIVAVLQKKEESKGPNRPHFLYH